MAPKLTREEVKKHTAEDDLWFIVDHKVYDVSDFIDAHPGGSVVLQQVAGTDATEAFYNLHRHEVLHQYKSLCLGNVEGEEPEVIEQLPGDLSQVPYAEPLWLTPQFRSPFYSEKHKKLQKAMRKFVDEHITPEAREKELSGEYISQELIDKMAEANILAMRAGPGKHMHGRSLLGGAMDGKDYDSFSDLIVSQELTRHTSRGFQDGNMAGMTISLSAVIAWANDEELKNRVVDEVLSGKKKMCLAITEAFAGSDVAGLRTTAELSEDGSHYIVNGTKKWITNGMWSDYFVTGCKTKKGFSVLLIERSEGVETKKIKTAYSAAAATTFVEFDNVKVPAKNLLGEEHKGFVVIMSNFNHVGFHALHNMVAFQLTPAPGTMDDGCHGHALVPHRARRMPKMGAPTPRLRQTPHRPTRGAAKARPHDRPRRSQPSLDRANHLPNERHELQGAGQTPLRPDWAAQDLLHAQRARNRG